MTTPKLILLYGFAGIGKTTIAKRYVDQHSLAMNLDQDRIIGMLGLWPQNETEARKHVAELCKALAATYLKHRHDIIVPCLPTKTEQVQDFKNIAAGAGAQFLEIALTADRKSTIQRLLKRGTWGEESSPPITEADLPAIEKLYDDVSRALGERPDVIHVPSIEGDPDDTYRQFLMAVKGHSKEIRPAPSDSN
jgi:adenylate kinase family enzyme